MLPFLTSYTPFFPRSLQPPTTGKINYNMRPFCVHASSSLRYGKPIRPRIVSQGRMVCVAILFGCKILSFTAVCRFVR